jgi:hypothetical protein
MSGRSWEAGDVAAMLANPFYAIEICPSHSWRHPHPLSEAQWIASNDRAVAELGRKKWLKHLLEALRADHRDWDPGGPFAVADPYPAITVHPMLCREDQPILDEDSWVSANVRGLEEGERVWMSNLLSVLKGAYGGESPFGYRIA